MIKEAERSNQSRFISSASGMNDLHILTSDVTIFFNIDNLWALVRLSCLNAILFLIAIVGFVEGTVLYCSLWPDVDVDRVSSCDTQQNSTELPDISSHEQGRALHSARKDPICDTVEWRSEVSLQLPLAQPLLNQPRKF